MEANMPQHLTITTVAEANRKALAEHTLLAEHRIAARDGKKNLPYAYHLKDWFCAIGCALEPDVLAEVAARRLQMKRLHALVDAGLITVDTKDLFTLQDLQQKHDRWVATGASKGYYAALERMEVLTSP
jgi:hypothetical protein